jgi:hypothetical protein
MSGWCMITDMHYGDTQTEWERNWEREELAKYDKGIKDGEKIQKFLRLIS